MGWFRNTPEALRMLAGERVALVNLELVARCPGCDAPVREEHGHTRCTGCGTVVETCCEGGPS